MMELLLLGSNRGKNWEAQAIEKIIKSINSCETLKQLRTCRALINNYMFASIISGKDEDDQVLQLISSQLFFLLKTKETSLITSLLDEISSVDLESINFHS